MARRRTKKIEIIPPASVEPTEVTPEKERELLRNSSEGFQLIEWIYNFFTLHEPLMYMIYSRYKRLGINPVWNFFFSLFAYVLDSMYGIFVYSVVGLIILIILYSFGKVVGFWDFIGGLHIAYTVLSHKNYLVIPI
jgi:hypothetical protein